MEKEEYIETIVHSLILVFSIFLSALTYNLFLVPNNLVIGGVSGLAIILKELANINDTIVIYSANAILLVLSYFILGSSKTKKAVVGAILYPVMITFTIPIAKFLVPLFVFEEFWITVLITSILYGFSSGMIFKYHYSTGGSDIIISICSQLFKVQEGKSMRVLNFLIIAIGGYVFGFQLMVYALIILYLSSLVLDKVLFEIGDSKIFYVFTGEVKKVEKVILNEFKTGFTVLPTEGGYSHKKGKLLMTVLPNREYYHFKHKILEVDDKAFFIISDCYESQGGYKKKNIPYV